MKARNTTLLLVLILSGLASCQEKSKMEFSVKVVDDEGKPVPECEAGAIIFDKNAGTANGYKRIAEITDEQGVAYFNLTSDHSRVSYGAKAPEGYYRSFGKEFYFKGRKNGIWQLKGEQFKMVLKRIKNPIAMYAASVGMNGKVEIPGFDKPFGFDLMASDWVAPHGKGKVPDLIFHLVRNMRGPKDYDATLTVTFSNKGDGFVGIKAPVEAKQESQLVMPYEAPEKGYQDKLVKSTQKKSGTATVPGYDKSQHYFIRVRTKLDNNGNIESALYGKIQGDIVFWNNSVLRFTYYLNPTPNDLNVEFNPKKNLIDTGFRGHKVQAP